MSGWHVALLLCTSDAVRGRRVEALGGTDAPVLDFF
jgi:hypothetical protein